MAQNKGIGYNQVTTLCTPYGRYGKGSFFEKWKSYVKCMNLKESSREFVCIKSSNGLNFNKYIIPDRREQLKSSLELHCT